MSALPRRFIFDASDLRAWQSSPTHEDILRFVSALTSAAESTPVSGARGASAVADAVVALLACAEAWIAEYPPIAQPMRFGNRAFREWHARLLREAIPLVDALMTSARPAGAACGDTDISHELAGYLCEAFGNATRLDYGTGHETAFIVFLYALGRAGVVSASDARALALRAFPAYARLARTLQRTYGLEPAGSHGVWCLDDYQFLSFIFGASQFVGDAAGSARSGLPLPLPRALLDADTRADLRADFLYADALCGVLEVKHGAPFAEHSPALFELASMPSWSRVVEVLGRMYRGEVLGKLPVAQHFVFGSLVAATWTPSRAPELSSTGYALRASLQGDADGT